MNFFKQMSLTRSKTTMLPEVYDETCAAGCQFSEDDKKKMFQCTSNGCEDWYHLVCTGYAGIDLLIPDLFI